MPTQESKEIAWKNLPRTKQAVIATLDNANRSIVNEMRNNPLHTVQYYNALSQLLNKVIVEIASRNIFDAPEGWFYSFVITNKSAALYIQHVAEIQMDENGNAILDVNEKFRLINYPVRLLTVEEYASVSKTEAGTVRQWI